MKNYKPFTSEPIVLSESKSEMLDDIIIEPDKRGIITGVVYKEPCENNGPAPAKNALVTLYKGDSPDSGDPIYHTYTDEKGSFLFPVTDTKAVYRIKAFYCRTDDASYTPYLSKPFKVSESSIQNIVCNIEKNDSRIIAGKLTNLHYEPRKNATVKLYITIGPDKIPIIQLAKTKTDAAGRFEFQITAEGNYCILISI